MLAALSAVRAPVRVLRAPLERDPSLRSLVAAIAGLHLPFVLSGRWGLAGGGDASARVLVAGTEPVWELPEGEDPFEAFDQVPSFVGDAPAGVIGGGLVGWLGFELGRGVERTLGPQPPRPQPLQPARLAWYGNVLRRDELGDWWVEALVPEAASDGGERLRAALVAWQARIDASLPEVTATLGSLRPHRGASAHRAATRETIERIYAGELFQANVCLRLEASLDGPAAGLAARVLEGTDPWYGAWIDGSAGRTLVSSSPELFLRRTGREVTTGPIKGTSPRAAGSLDPARDPSAAGLLASSKDHAEHVMIVDLMRNDLGRVCDYGSVRWDADPRIKAHAGVWHLVSEVGGRLHDGLGDGRLLRATFPPGSVTGAPKVQAMRVIAAVEGTGREAYTGAHGIASPVSGLELAVTIRTIETSGDRAWVGVGGGIVADSDPEGELQEALGKASALAAAAGTQVDTTQEQAGSVSSSVPWMRSQDRRPDPAGGLLETLVVSGGRPGHLLGHLTRLERSVAAVGYTGGLPDDLAGRVRRLAATAAGPSRLRVLVSPGAEGELDIELQLLADVPRGPAPVPLAPFVLPGGLGAHKWLDRRLVDTVTARLGSSPLLLDADGSVLESGWANVWWEEGGVLCTSPADGRILPGVTRAALLGRADEAPVPLRETGRPYDASLDALPLLLTSARGVSVARLAGTTPAALARASVLAEQLAPLLVEPI